MGSPDFLGISFIKATMATVKKTLICGVSGQDGAYLAKLLVEKGYQVFGTARDAQMLTFPNLKTVGVKDKVTCLSMTLTDFRSVIQTLVKVQPDEIYNLAGQSSVGLSFDQPVETLESISVGVLNLLEALRFTGIKARLYNTGSSECFGNTGGVPADKETPFRPRSPHAVAKATAFWEVANYREAYNLHVCTGSSSTTNLHYGQNDLSPARLSWLPAELQQGAKKNFLWGISPSPVTGAGCRNMSRPCGEFFSRMNRRITWWPPVRPIHWRSL